MARLLALRVPYVQEKILFAGTLSRRDAEAVQSLKCER